MAGSSNTIKIDLDSCLPVKLNKYLDETDGIALVNFDINLVISKVKKETRELEIGFMMAVMEKDLVALSSKTYPKKLIFLSSKSDRETGYDRFQLQ